MDLVTIAIGVAAVMYGAYTVYLRKAHPKGFGKLEAMRSMWGQVAGTMLHVFAYTVVPIVFGLVAIVLGINGGSLL